MRLKGPEGPIRGYEGPLQRHSESQGVGTHARKSVMLKSRAPYEPSKKTTPARSSRPLPCDCGGRSSARDARRVSAEVQFDAAAAAAAAKSLRAQQELLRAVPRPAVSVLRGGAAEGARAAARRGGPPASQKRPPACACSTGTKGRSQRCRYTL